MYKSAERTVRVVGANRCKNRAMLSTVIVQLVLCSLVVKRVDTSALCRNTEVLYGNETIQDGQKSDLPGVDMDQFENQLEGSLDNITACPTWFYLKTLASGRTACQCGSGYSSIIECLDGQSNAVYMYLLQGYSMTYSDKGDLVVGASLYGYKKNAYKNLAFRHFSHGTYYKLPLNPSGLKQLCEHYYNRDGQLCGKCRKGFAPQVYSYNMSCVNCSDYASNWMKYVAVAFLPLTAFFILMITFRISATSGLLNTFICMSQIVSAPIVIRRLTISNPKHPWLLFLLSSLYGMSNLDFFRSLYPAFYLNCEVTTIQVLTLDYAVAIYPIVLITLTYILVELHDHSFRIIIWLWKPFHICFARLRREWNIKASLIEAFATFLLLSYVKFLNVSSDLLLPTRVFNIHGESRLHLYYNGAEYFGKEHLPYGILALAVLLVFNIFPLLLLLLYPCRCFQRCLNYCRLRCQLLHTFMDAFQGHYKDGTNGTRDCRWFAALYLIVRIAFMILMPAIFITQDDLWLSIGAFIIIMMLFLIAIFRPYKLPMYNNIDIFLLSLFAIIFVTVPVRSHTEFKNISICICSILASTYLIGLILHKVGWRYKMCTGNLHCCKERDPDFDEALPYRMLHAEECVPLLVEPLQDYCSRAFNKQNNQLASETY